MKNKVRLMNKVNQMVILEAPKYMVTDVTQVWEDKQGMRTGFIKPTKHKVVYDKVSDVWRLVA